MGAAHPRFDAGQAGLLARSGIVHGMKQRPFGTLVAFRQLWFARHPGAEHPMPGDQAQSTS